MHEDDHQSCDSNEGHANHIQTHSQPAHGTAEQIEGSLVLIQQLLIPGRKHTKSINQPCSLQVLSFKEKQNKVISQRLPVKEFVLFPVSMHCGQALNAGDNVGQERGLCDVV